MAIMTAKTIDCNSFTVKLDPNQADYDICPWAKFVINTVQNSLTIHAPNCNLSFQWLDSTGLPFLRFMAQANPKLLLEKMAKPDMFDQKATVCNLIGQAEKQNRHNLAEILKKWYCIMDEDLDCPGADCMFSASYMTLPGAQIEDLPGMLVYNYQSVHEVVFKIFHVYVQPYLAKKADQMGLPK